MNIETWIAAIATRPRDTLTWDAAADWCEEMGLLDKAVILRQPLLRSRRPGPDNAMSLVQEVRSFDWLPWASMFKYFAIFPNHLPPTVFEALEPRDPVKMNWQVLGVREYSSEVDAYKALLIVALGLPSTTFELPEGAVL